MTDTKNVDDSKKKANAKELKYIDDKQAQNIGLIYFKNEIEQVFN